MSVKNYFTNPLKWISGDIAIDLGTANTLVYIKGKGVMINEPSIVAKSVHDDKIIAVGYEAKSMVGRTHREIETVRPLRDGVIADFNMTDGLLQGFINKINMNRLSRPRMVICVPSGVTEVERRAVRDSGERANASEVYLIEEPVAAAIGIGLDISKAVGNIIIDIGGGTTEIAVIALSGIVCEKSIKVAGDTLTNDIVYYMRTKHNLSIGDRTAEKIKIDVGSCTEKLDTPPDDMRVQGRDLLTGKPKEKIISYIEVTKAVDKSVIRIEDSIMETLSQTPPELAADIYNTGIYLAGGGALLRGLDERLSKKTDLPVYIAEDPLQAVVRGTGICLKNLEKFKSVLIK